MAKLTEEEFLQVFQAPMQNVTETAEPQVDILPYVDAVPISDLDGYNLSNGSVAYVYRDAQSRFDQVLVSTDSANIFLVIVVDLGEAIIHGHHLLNLPELYGAV